VTIGWTRDGPAESAAGRICRSWSGTQAHTLATTDGTVSHAGDDELTLGGEFGRPQLSGERARRSADG